MRFYRWTEVGGADEPETVQPWILKRLQLVGLKEWDLDAGRYIEDWSPNNTAYYEWEGEHEDLACTTFNLHVYSPRLKRLMESLMVEGIQYLPLRIKHLHSDQEVHGYHIANYLHVIDCLDRERSRYEIWTEETLLFPEKVPWKIGKFRDVRKAVLERGRIGGVRVFRLWGWEMMVVVREDVKRAIEEAGLTGCQFWELEVV